jgi:hypothetical protein
MTIDFPPYWVAALLLSTTARQWVRSAPMRPAQQKSNRGSFWIHWDVVSGGLCGHTKDIAHRLVTVKDGSILLKLDISGLGKAFIPIYGLFAQPEYGF